MKVVKSGVLEKKPHKNLLGRIRMTADYQQIADEINAGKVNRELFDQVFADYLSSACISTACGAAQKHFTYRDYGHAAGRLDRITGFIPHHEQGYATAWRSTPKTKFPIHILICQFNI